MVIRGLSPSSLPPAPGHHQVVIAAGQHLIVVNGQVGRAADGTLVGPGDHIAQAAQAFTNLRHALQAAGATGLDVVQYRMAVVGYEDWMVGPIIDTGKQVFGDQWMVAPSILLGVSSLGRSDLLFEVECMAVLDG
jgi:enamine deaminase RidA (YjgF/YER057c/UK114 family)